MQIIKFDTLESTQDLALQKKQECAIIANKQTKGRGRFDRRWESIEGNLLASIVIKADISQIFALVMGISVAITDAIKAGQIKWPNDILINNKKVCGILIEKGCDDFYVIGVVLNVAYTPNINGLIYPATSLKDEGITAQPLSLLKEIITNLKNNINDKNLFNKYKSLLYGIGKPCKINDISGTLLNVDKSGFISIKTETQIKKVFAGDLFFT